VDPESLIQLLTITQRSLDRNLEGFTHVESLAQPPGGNCVNWLLGHILVHRNHMLAALGEGPAWTADGAARYDRGSEPITGDGDGVEPLDSLLAALKHSNQELVEAVRRGGAAKLAENARLGPGQRIDFLVFHEAYHAGQVGLMRRIVGKAPGIR
jgi:hypothetical protein